MKGDGPAAEGTLGLIYVQRHYKQRYVSTDKNKALLFYLLETLFRTMQVNWQTGLILGTDIVEINPQCSTEE